MTIATTLLLAVMGYVDWSTRRIPNALNVALLLLALAVFFSSHGISFYQWLLNIGLALLITLPGYLSGKLGGGDVKLLLALSPLWPPLKLLITFASGVLLLALLLAVAEKICKQAEYAKRGLPIGTAVFLGALVASLLH